MTFAASAATAVWMWAEIDAVVSWATSGTQRGFFAAASCCSRVMVNGLSGVDQPEHVPAVKHAELALRRRRPRADR